MPRKRKEETDAPKVIPELEALPPRKRAFVEAYTDPTSPTYSNATRSIIAVGHPDTPAAREDGSRMLARADVQAGVKAVLAACGASEGNLAALMWEYAQDRHHGVRSSSVRATETLMRVAGMLEPEAATAQIQMVLPQLSVSDIRAALASPRAEAEGNEVQGG